MVSSLIDWNAAVMKNYPHTKKLLLLEQKFKVVKIAMIVNNDQRSIISSLCGNFVLKKSCQPP